MTEPAAYVAEEEKVVAVVVRRPEETVPKVATV
jgi:hypothetical protein